MSSIKKIDMSALTDEPEVPIQKPVSISSIRAKLAQSKLEEPINAPHVAALSETTPDNNGDAPDRSTYYQVLKNMRSAAELLNQVAILSEALETNIERLENADIDLSTSIKNLSTKVEETKNSVSILINNINNNGTPGGYTNPITHEIKLASAVGLGPVHGLTGNEYVYIQTVSATGLTDVPFTTFQSATITGEVTYVRQASGATGWNAWKIVAAGGGSAAAPIIYSATQPSDSEQDEGGLWMYPTE